MREPAALLKLYKGYVPVLCHHFVATYSRWQLVISNESVRRTIRQLCSKRERAECESTGLRSEGGSHKGDFDNNSRGVLDDHLGRRDDVGNSTTPCRPRVRQNNTSLELVLRKRCSGHRDRRCRRRCRPPAWLSVEQSRSLVEAWLRVRLLQ